MSMLQKALAVGLTLLSLSSSAFAQAAGPADSGPTVQSVVEGRNATFVVRFDAMVDHRGASLTILRDGQVVETLRPSLNAPANVLAASAPRLQPGDYEINWAVREMPGGGPTQGTIPFTVRQ